MPNIVFNNEPRLARKHPMGKDGAAIWSILAVVGLVVACVGWLDLALLWIPPHPETPDWMFHLFGAQQRRMHILTVGMALLTVGVIGLQQPRFLAVMSVCYAMLTAVMTAVVVLQVLDIPRLTAAAASRGEAVGEPLMAILGSALAYGGLFAWLARKLWQHQPNKPTSVD